MRPTPKRLLNVLRSITAQHEPKRVRTNALHRAHVDAMRRIATDINVVGIGIGHKSTNGVETKEQCICFYVEHKLDQGSVHPDFLVPAVLSSSDGRAAFTDVKVLGRIQPGGSVGFASAALHGIQSGASIKNVDGDLIGTIAAIVDKDGEPHVLSAAHILARLGSGTAGKHILSPGNGAYSANWIADLSDKNDFLSGQYANTMDAALARIRGERVRGIVDGIAKVASPVKINDVALERKVTLLGAKSGQVSGIVKDCHHCVVMDYPHLGKVGFHDQVLCTSFTKEGDSGALVLDDATGHVVGLHLGSVVDRDPAKSGSLFSPIGPIVREFGFTFR